MAITQGRADLLRRAWQDDGERHAAIGGERVSLEHPHLDLARHQALGWHEASQAGDDLVAPGEDLGFRRGKSDRGHGLLLLRRLGRTSNDVHAEASKECYQPTDLSKPAMRPSPAHAKG